MLLVASAGWRSRPTSAAAPFWPICWTLHPQWRRSGSWRRSGAPAARRRHGHTQSQPALPRVVARPHLPWRSLLPQRAYDPRSGLPRGAARGLAYCRSNSWERRSRRRILRPGWPRRSLPHWPDFAGCSWSQALRLDGSWRNRATKRQYVAPSGSIFCWMEQSSVTATGCGSPCGCSIFAPAIRWSGQDASIGRRMTCSRCRTRSRPKWSGRSTQRYCSLRRNALQRDRQRIRPPMTCCSALCRSSAVWNANNSSGRRSPQAGDCLGAGLCRGTRLVCLLV